MFFNGKNTYVHENEKTNEAIQNLPHFITLIIIFIENKI